MWVGVKCGRGARRLRRCVQSYLGRDTLDVQTCIDLLYGLPHLKSSIQSMLVRTRPAWRTFGTSNTTPDNSYVQSAPRLPFHSNAHLSLSDLPCYSSEPFPTLQETLTATPTPAPRSSPPGNWLLSLLGPPSLNPPNCLVPRCRRHLRTPRLLRLGPPLPARRHPGLRRLRRGGPVLGWCQRHAAAALLTACGRRAAARGKPRWEDGVCGWRGPAAGGGPAGQGRRG